MNALIKRADSEVSPASESGTQLVTMIVGRHLFGIPVLAVRDIVVPERIYRVPLAPDEVAGSINLRGRIVTVIDLCRRLGQTTHPSRKCSSTPYCVTVSQGNEIYGLLVDKIGDVQKVDNNRFERPPSTLGSLWRDIVTGVFRLDRDLLMLMDVERILDLGDLRGRVPT